MPRFNFRLQKLLSFRRLSEKAAKDAYLAARARVVEGEQALESMKRERVRRLEGSPTTLRERMVLDAFVARMEDDERAQASILSVLEQEETEARDGWILTKQEAEGIDKLRAKAKIQWELTENRIEQNELDEWVTIRKTS